MKKLDFVAVGDIVIDCFIKLKDAVTEKGSRGESRLCLNFKDKIPYQSATIVPAVGNSPNAAVAAARLSLASALITDLGDDLNGEECLNSLIRDGVRADWIRKHFGKKTNYHFVLWYDADRTILIKHEEYERRFPNLEAPAWIYLSSLGENSFGYHEQVAAWLEKNPSTKLAFQPGTYQIKFGTEKLKMIYARTEIFFCNVEEAQKILSETSRDIKTLLTKVQSLGPKIVVMTDGPKGGYCLHNNNVQQIPVYPDSGPPLERTGAGDAFSATVVTALALGLPLEQALLWGPINSMSVVQKIGAQEGLLTRTELEKYLASAPADYRLKKI